MKTARTTTEIPALRAEIERLNGSIELEHELLESEPFDRPTRADIHARIRRLSSDIAGLRKREVAILESEERRAVRVWKTEPTSIKVTKTA
jgi:hypothetical protein